MAAQRLGQKLIVVHFVHRAEPVSAGGPSAFSPDGARIVSGSRDKTLRLWDAATGKALGAPLEGHGDRVTAVAFSPDGHRIVSGSNDRTLRLWDAAMGMELALFETDAATQCVAAAGDVLAAGDTNSRVDILDWLPDEAAKADWIARMDGPQPAALPTNRPAVDDQAAPDTELSSVHSPAKGAEASPEMPVTDPDLSGARFVETYRDRHRFQLADGRIYLDGLIAVASLELARATVDHMLDHAPEPPAPAAQSTDG